MSYYTHGLMCAIDSFYDAMISPYSTATFNTVVSQECDDIASILLEILKSRCVSAEEVTQLVKRLLCKQKNMSSDPQYACKKI